MIGININDKDYPFTELIFSGNKTIETRRTASLHPYIGQRVGVIRTGKGKATLVGFVTIGEPIYYRTEEEFRKDENKHCVCAGSKYDIDKNGKYGYPIINPNKTTHRHINSKGIVARQI
jgi:predicted transcriptional regulator